jgi:hypothetical protein
VGQLPRIDETQIKVFPEQVNYKVDAIIHQYVDFVIYAIPASGCTHVGNGDGWHTK